MILNVGITQKLSFAGPTKQKLIITAESNQKGGVKKNSTRGGNNPTVFSLRGIHTGLPG